MNRKFSTILTFLLLLALSTSTVGAAGAIKLSGGFRLGSLIFDGSMTGLGGYRDGVTVTLVGSGIPVVTCTNQGGNQAPGQNPPKVTANGTDYIGPQDITKKGKAPVGVETVDPVITGIQGGCPNDNWTATIDFVFWTNATITVTNNTSGVVEFTQNYNCVTTRNPDSVSCVAAP
jgi:hypothetical protein